MADSTSIAKPRVAIVGGGVAGLAAAVALAPRGCQVELFESRRKLGGRAGSYVDRVTGESIDHCQHVAMGCCTNYLDLCRRTGIAELFTCYRGLHFFGPDGRRSDFFPLGWFPAPLHLLGPLVSLKYLSWADKISIARAMHNLAWIGARDTPGEMTVLDWLRQQRQSEAAIERFWKVVLVSALAESLDRASLVAARKVFVDGFIAHRDASHIWVPRVSLDELYDRRVAEWIEQQGAAVHRESPVAEITMHQDRPACLRLADGRELDFDFVIVAVPWTRMATILSPRLLEVVDPTNDFAAIPSAPISSVHLWFDRPITELPHAVFVERLAQWVFSRNFGNASGEHYYQVVISASYDLANRERQSVIDEVMADLAAVFPLARTARLLRWQLISEQQAVFSVRPGLDSIRPAQQTAIPKLLLAGDWTRTGWPATMEGAVRSGYLAAEAVLTHLGRPERIVVPDLARNWLTKRF